MKCEFFLKIGKNNRSFCLLGMDCKECEFSSEFNSLEDFKYLLRGEACRK
jgi:hypothetical protein